MNSLLKILINFDKESGARDNIWIIFEKKYGLDYLKIVSEEFKCNLSKINKIYNYIFLYKFKL